MNTAVIICGHGTRVAEGAAQFVALTEAVGRRMAPVPVTHAFLELSEPPLPERLDTLYAEGVRSFLVMPGMLLTAGHVKMDIPDLIRRWHETHRDAEVRYGRALGLCPSMLDAARDRIEEALARTSVSVPNAESLLLVIGRGSTDPDANADAAKLARLLWEGMGFAWGEIGYFAVTFPTVDAALERAARQGLRRVVVAPWLLFDGVLARHLDDRVAEAARRASDVEFVTAGYLDDHEGVVATFVARIREALADEEADGSCMLCKQRAPILAFDDDVEATRDGHHHHDHHAGGDHHHDHHHHGHARHPFADHPHGPNPAGAVG